MKSLPNPIPRLLIPQLRESFITESTLPLPHMGDVDATPLEEVHLLKHRSSSGGQIDETAGFFLLQKIKCVMLAFGLLVDHQPHKIAQVDAEVLFILMHR